MSLSDSLNAIAYLIEKGEIRQALQQIKDAQLIFGNLGPLVVNEATCHTLLGHPNKAIALLENRSIKEQDIDLLYRAKSKIHFHQKEYRKAIDVIGQINLELVSSSTLHLRSECHFALAQYAEAAHDLLQIMKRSPNLCDTHIWRYIQLSGLNRSLPEAFNELKKLAKAVDNLELKLSLAILAKKLGHIDLSFRLLSYLKENNPNYDFRIENEIASLYVDRGEIATAIAILEALSLRTKHPVVLANLSRAYSRNFDYRSSQEAYEKIPHHDRAPQIISNFLMQQLYFQNDRQEILSLHRRECNTMRSSYPVICRDESPAGKLKIAVLSSDFRRHSVSYFVSGLFLNKPPNIELHCLHNGSEVDDVTEFFKKNSDNYLNVVSLSDDDLLSVISREQFSVIVELNGHTAGNRLATLSRCRGVPVVSAIGYPATTGLTGIQFRISDHKVDPADCNDFFAEKTLRTKGCYLNYRVFDSLPEPIKIIRPEFNFGSFNNYQKLSTEVIFTWSEILKQVNGATLTLKAGGIKGDTVSKRLLNAFEKNDVDSSRIILKYPTRNYADHMIAYQDIDLALDTFPFCGATTTMEALYMQTPVLTRVMAVNQGRVTYSILHALQLEQEFATWTVDDYINRAVFWASQRSRKNLNHISNQLRRRMHDHGLIDNKEYAENFFSLLQHAHDEFHGS